MTAEIREQTGIDEILKAEGIEKEMEQLRMIASGRVMDVDLASDPADEHPPRYREYPRLGVDSYDAIPEDSAPYVPSEHVALQEANAAPRDAEQPEAVAMSAPDGEATRAPAPAGGPPEAGSRVRISTVPDVSVARSTSGARVPNDPFDKPTLAPETNDDLATAAGTDANVGRPGAGA